MVPQADIPVVQMSIQVSMNAGEHLRAGAALLAGSTNADIARRRECSERTVANQVQAIYRKPEARSRAELAVQVQGSDPVCR